MGNQVCALLPAESYLYRVAYSFTAGDMPTIVLHPKGKFLSYWGQRDLTSLPVEEDVVALIKNLRAFYMENKELMCFGNMVKPLPYKTEEVIFACDFGRSYVAEQVLTAAYSLDGVTAQIFVNYNKEEKTIVFQGETITIKAFSVVKKEI